MPSRARVVRRRIPTLQRRGHRGLAVLVAVAGLVAASPAHAAEGPKVDGRERNVLDRVNAVRADHGLGALTTTSKLSGAADRHSRWELRVGILSHRLPGEQALQPRLRRASKSAPVGEVLFWGTRSVRSALIVRAWMNSPSHRALLLSDRCRVAGIAIRSGKRGLYATVDLAAR